MGVCRSCCGIEKKLQWEISRALTKETLNFNVGELVGSNERYFGAVRELTEVNVMH